jgi:phage FluMu protein Com
MKLLRKKEIKCMRCKLLVTVPKDHHFLKMCPKCKEKSDGLIYLIKDMYNIVG